jgi:DNA-binding protein HU-beta
MSTANILTLKDLVSSLSQSTQTTQAKIEQIIKAYNQSIIDTIKTGKKVRIYGFGTYFLTHKAARGGVNPKTLEKLVIPAHTAPKIVFADNVKKALKNM